MSATVSQLQEQEGRWLSELNDANAARSATPFFDKTYEKMKDALIEAFQTANTPEVAWDINQKLKLLESFKNEHRKIVNGGRKAEEELRIIRERMDSLGHTAKLRSV